jgi:HD-GYP domain-containing protein (c-di-GMP phosphodiesterase class II)
MKSSEGVEPVRILTIGIEGALLAELKVDTQSLIQVTMPLDLDAILAAEPVDCRAIFVQSNDVALLKECAQLLRSIYQEVVLVSVVTERQAFQREELKKNGFSEVYLLPFDKDSFREDLNAFIVADPQYKRISLNDLQSDTVLAFDTFVYLPHSKKYVAYSKSGLAIEPERLTKLKEKSADSLSVKDSEMQKFYTYFSEQSEAGRAGALSETQKIERTQKATCTLLRSVLVPAGDAATFDGGRELLEEATKLAGELVAHLPPGSLYKMIQGCLALKDSQSGHAQKVLCIAEILGTRLGVKRQDDLRVAALFHDLGMADIPSSISDMPFSQLTADDKKRMELHPEISVRILKEKRVSLSEHAVKIVMQHHERYDGTGYPNQMHGNGFHPDSQVLAMADELAERTRPSQPGRSETLDDVLESWKLEIQRGEKQHYLPKLLQNVLDLFSAAKKV